MRTLHGAACFRFLGKWRASALHPQVEWPLNMVVDRSTQNLYQALLRHLLGLAMVERELHIIWRTYQSTRALFRCAPPLFSHSRLPAAVSHDVCRSLPCALSLLAADGSALA